MPTHLPTPGNSKDQSPDAAEVLILSRGLRSAAGQSGLLTDTQRLLLSAICSAMTGYTATLDAPLIGPSEFADALSARTSEFRSRIVQLMLLLALVLRPLPPEVIEQIRSFAAELMVDDGMLEIAGKFAEGSLGLAAFDFRRNGYTADWHEQELAALHTTSELSDPWEVAVTDPALARRWRDLESLPSETLGRRVTDFYRARGFVYPGEPGSAPPLLAQHDWVHVLADFGTTVESELEVFAFIARANDDVRAFSLLAMVVSLFETGYLRTGAGLFEASPGHLEGEAMATRVADAMRRGASCQGSVDFLRTDWFELADLPVSEARQHFGVVSKSPRVLRAGSPGPWERGGISPFQMKNGAEMAERQDRVYEPYGASLIT